MPAKATKRKRTTPMGSNEPNVPEVYAVETILNYQFSGGRHWFFVKWAGWSASANTWEPVEGLLGCRERILDYFQRSHGAKIDLSGHESVTKVHTKSTNSKYDYPRKSQNDISSSPLETTRIENLGILGPLPRISLSPIIRLQRIDEATRSTPSAPVKEIKRCHPRTRNAFTKTPSISSSPFPSPPPSTYSDNSGAESDINSVDDSSATLVCEEQDESDISTPVDDELDENDPRVVTVLTILPNRDMKVYKIHGAMNVTGNLTLLVEWDTDDRDLNLVEAKLMNRVFPQKVIEFYEKNLQFQRSNSNT